MRGNLDIFEGGAKPVKKYVKDKPYATTFNDQWLKMASCEKRLMVLEWIIIP